MSKCICKGNWRSIVKKYDHLIGKKFSRDCGDPHIYTFFGLVHADDDYYYGMQRESDRQLHLVSCCIALKHAGF